MLMNYSCVFETLRIVLSVCKRVRDLIPYRGVIFRVTSLKLFLHVVFSFQRIITPRQLETPNIGWTAFPAEQFVCLPLI